MIIKTALTIAGSDCSGGAGIQADLKTMTMNGVYAMSAITALTAQNTTGVRAIQEATPAFLREQIDAIFEDIYPDAVKIGMVASSKLIDVIADRLIFHGAKNIVVDPVMVSTSGSALINNDANDFLYAHDKSVWFEGKRINNPNTHGTGCTLSSAIASNLAKGFTLTEAVQKAKEYISEALAAQLNLGKGPGPLLHNFSLIGKFSQEV